jgi:hypothetical protein
MGGKRGSDRQISKDTYEDGDSDSDDGAAAGFADRGEDQLASEEVMKRRRIIKTRVLTAEETRLRSLSSNSGASSNVFQNIVLAAPAAAPPAAHAVPQTEIVEPMLKLHKQMLKEANLCRQAILNRSPSEYDSDLLHFAEILKRRQLIMQAQWRKLQPQNATAVAPADPIAPQVISISRLNSGGASLAGQNLVGMAVNAPAPSFSFPVPPLFGATASTATSAANNNNNEDDDDVVANQEPAFAPLQNLDTEWEEIGRFELSKVYHNKLGESSLGTIGSNLLRMERHRTTRSLRRFVMYNSGGTGTLLVNMTVPDEHKLTTSTNKKNITYGVIRFVGQNIGGRGHEMFSMKAGVETAQRLSKLMTETKDGET